MQTSSVSEARLSERACEAVADDPDVVDTIWFSSRQIPFQDRNIRLSVTELGKTLEKKRLIFKSPPMNDVASVTIAGPSRRARFRLATACRTMSSQRCSPISRSRPTRSPTTAEISGTRLTQYAVTYNKAIQHAA